MWDDWLRERGGVEVLGAERVQVLWSGYGEIRRVRLREGTVVVKEVRPPSDRHHPRGWSGARGHARKMRSYDVEWTFYERWASRCADTCRLPRLLGGSRGAEGWLFVLSDLDEEGLTRHRRDLEGGVLSERAVDRCLAWLASFHATFLGTSPEGLWPVGTYWHLETRPDELEAMLDPELRAAAATLDRVLTEARFQTFCHGDAKLANFCFAPDDSCVGAVDFQYVGGGVGVKDLAYFLGSVWDGDELEARAPGAVDRYFAFLREALDDSVDGDTLEEEWRRLYPVAWADFERFLDGWAPDHWKRSGYAKRQVRRALVMVRPP